MVKQRMTTADVAGEVACLRQRILGMRLANFYDLNSKTYLLKLARSGEDGEKVFVVLESGIRFHTTQYARDRPDAPSNFALKLRKHLRARRLEDVRQLGTDRVVDFAFGSGEACHHLLLELYAQGNVLLCDANYEILTLLRSHRDDSGGVAMMARHAYPIHSIRLRAPLGVDALMATLAAAAPDASLRGVVAGALPYGPALAQHCVQGAGLEADRRPAMAPLSDAEVGALLGTVRAAEAWLDGCEDSAPQGYITLQDPSQPCTSRRKQRGKGRDAGSGIPSPAEAAPEVPPSGDGGEAEGGKYSQELKPSASPIVPAGVPTLQPPVVGKAALAMNGGLQPPTATGGPQRCMGLRGEPSAGPPAAGGLDTVLGKEDGAGTARETADAANGAPKEENGGGPAPAFTGNGAGPEVGPAYDEYDPLPLAQHAGRRQLRFDTFDAALDDFYAKVEGQRAAAARAAQERAALSKVDRIRSDQTARADALAAEAADAEAKAQLVEYHAEAVDGAIGAVRGALASGLSWVELRRLIKDEREAGNPVAALVHALHLERNAISLVLPNWVETEEGDDAALTRPATLVEIDLDLNAHANARALHATRKAHTAKQAKTLAANSRALQAAEKKAHAQLSQVKTAAAVQQVRKPHWFEKFHWFLTSENYLVVAGRDAQQNELLVKRYLGKDDLYLHADLHGAATTVLCNHSPERPVPPTSLAQAGCSCVCRSGAWDAKIVTSAWWVAAHQVSKTAPSGEYLPTGSFMVRGHKNFLPPQQLVMGLGFLFKLDESCVAAHLGERAPRGPADNREDAVDSGDDPGPSPEDKGARRGEGAADSESSNDPDSGLASDSGPAALRGSEISVNGDVAPAAADGPGPPDGVTAREWGAPCVETTINGHAREGAEGVAAPGMGRGQRSALEAFLDSAPGYPAAFNAYARYGLGDAEGACSEEAQSQDGQADSLEDRGRASEARVSAGVGARRHLSAKQRRDLKKGAQPAPEQGAQPALKPGAQPRDAPPQQPVFAGGEVPGPQAAKPSDAAAVPAPSVALGPDAPAEALAAAVAAERARRADKAAVAAAAVKARGQRGRQKKAHEKYAGQDEEDRQLALQLLAPAGEHKDRKAKRAARKQAVSGGGSGEKAPARGRVPTSEELAAVGAPRVPRAAHVRTARLEEGVATGLLAVEPGTGPPAAEQLPAPEVALGAVPPCQPSPEAAAAAEGAAEAGLSCNSAAEHGAGRPRLIEDLQADEAAEVAALLAEEHVELVPEAERDALRDVDSLTGAPRPDDILLYALPVCAPYAALQGYKLKVKLTPGTQRKGRAGRQAVELLARAAEASERERQLLRAVPEMETINALVGSVKLSMPGLARLKTDARRSKKAARSV